jgi:hypothetical protein
MLDVCRAGSVDLYALHRKVSQKMACCVHITIRGRRSVPRCFHLILKFCKPLLVAGMI